jgi:hypothetical protein
MSAQQTPETSRNSDVRIAKSEQGVIRVFAISRPMAEMARALRQQPKAVLASAMLGHDVSDEDIELFAIADLAGIGLPRYLTEGYDVDAEALRADRTRLEALDGYVLLLHSGAARAGDVILSPSPELTLIGTYTEPKPSHSAPPVAVEAAMPYSGLKPASGAQHRTRVGSALTAAAVLLALLLIWWIFR